MKRKLAVLSVLVMLLALAGCQSNKPIQREQVKNFTQEQLEEKLEGLTAESLCEAWGEPDGRLSGFWGYVWEVDSQSQIVIYFDRDGCVEIVRIHTDHETD